MKAEPADLQSAPFWPLRYTPGFFANIRVQKGEGTQGVGEWGLKFQVRAIAAIIRGVSEPNNIPPSGDQPRTENFSHKLGLRRGCRRRWRGDWACAQGQVILDSPKEFVIDFLQGLTRPYQV